MFSKVQHVLPPQGGEGAHVFPTRLLALACKAGVLKDPGETEHFLRTVENISLFIAKLTIPNGISFYSFALVLHF